MALTTRNTGFAGNYIYPSTFIFQKLDPAIRYYSSRRRIPTLLWGSRFYPG
jgi:hypothetical protein